MISRRRALTLAPAGVLACGLLGAWGYLASKPDAIAALGGPFSLLDGDGRTVTDRDFRGRVMLVYFGYTHCPDACPTALADMASALDLLGERRRDVAVLFITVDPERDTPAVMKDYVSAFGIPITALSGPIEAIRPVAKEYRVYFAKHSTKDGYDMDHSSIIYAMDRRGRFAMNFTHETPPEKIAEGVRTLL